MRRVERMEEEMGRVRDNIHEIRGLLNNFGLRSEMWHQGTEGRFLSLERSISGVDAKIDAVLMNFNAFSSEAEASPVGRALVKTAADVKADLERTAADVKLDLATLNAVVDGHDDFIKNIRFLGRVVIGSSAIAFITAMVTLYRVISAAPV